jgi:hypothetical protein
MDDTIKRQLEKPVQGAFHKKLLEHCKGLVSISRNAMSSHYDDWDEADLVYRGQRHKDENDKKANKQGAPSKIVVPLTYAQVQTFIAFSMSLLQQRDHFFELEGTGEEDHRAAKLGEALLDQNLEFNTFTALLYQFMLDIGRFSIGVFKHSWVKETETVWVEEDVPTGILGGPMKLLGNLFNLPPAAPKKQQVPKEQVAYMGNKIDAISPYKFFPDTRLPLSRFQEGEFCASEDEVTRNTLKKGEKNGLYAGIKYITDMKGEAYEGRKNRWRNFSAATSVGGGRAQLKPTIILTCVQVELVPNEFLLDDGTPMGTSDQPEKWVVEYANDDRIIRAEQLGYVHNHYTYSVGQFSPDQHGLINESITEMISHLQAVIDWFINSHITNVRRHISNRLVVDPAGVFFEDLKEHKPVIRLKPNAANAGVDRFVKQLTMSDVTRGHITDVNTLMQFVSMTTAISDNLMGQYHTGRRSAREASNTSSASGSRLRNIVKIIFDLTLKPMGKDLLSNLRDGLDETMFVTITGEDFPDWAAYDAFKLQDGQLKVGVDRTKLAGRYDFKVFEGILPSDKYVQAETLEQTLLALMKNPQGLPILTQMLGYDPGKLFKEVLELRGIKHPDRFKIDAFRQQELQQQSLLQQQQENAINPVGNAGSGLPQPGGSQPVQPQQGTFESLLAGAAQ